MKTQNGTALVVILILVLISTLLGITAMNLVVMEQRVVVAHKLINESMAAAETGVKDAIGRLLAGTISDTGNEDSTTWTSSPLSTAGLQTAMSNTFTVSHQVVNGVVLKDSNTRPFYHIISTGTSVDVERTVDAVVSLTYTTSSIFTRGLTGCQGLRLKGVSTSSYRFSDPSYVGQNGDAAVLETGSYAIIEHGADIKGRVEAAGYVTVSGNSAVRKAVLSGNYISNAGTIYQDAIAASTVSGGGNVLGTIEANVNPNPVPQRDCDPLDIATLWSNAAAINSGNGSDLTVSSNISFSDGTYDYNDFEINAGKSITINGDVVWVINGNFQMNSNATINIPSGSSLSIYVNGSFTVESNAAFNNQSGNPASLVVYSNASSSSASDHQVSIEANHSFSGIIYAPNAAVGAASSGSGEFRGAIWGQYIEPATNNSNFDFYYDEDLANSGIGGTPTATDYTIMYWSEQ